MPERELKLPVQSRDVISYEDDVFAWVYLDQIDRVIRYEAYVVGYDERGVPATLELVLEEGALDVSAFPWLAQALAGAPGNETTASAEALLASQEAARAEHNPLLEWYRRLRPAELSALHRLFEQQEHELKRRHRGRWIKRLRALGYDVVSSL